MQAFIFPDFGFGLYCDFLVFTQECGICAFQAADYENSSKLCNAIFSPFSPVKYAQKLLLFFDMYPMPALEMNDGKVGN